MSLHQNKIKNISKTWFLMIIFFVVVIVIGYFFSRVMNNPNYLYFAIIFSLVMNFFSYWFSDKIVLKMSGAKPVDKNSYYNLIKMVDNLSMKAKLPPPKVYVIEDVSPNAFATGRNKKNSAIAVTTGLMNILEKNELEGVIAHELSHIDNRDILLSTIVVILVGFIALIADWFRWSLWFGGGNSKSENSNIMMIVGLILAILAPITMTLIQLAISRKREFLADSSGALLTVDPRSLADALKKISENPNPLKRGNRATAHMYISNPFKKKGGVSKLFMTHPPVEERIEALLGHKSF